MIVRRLPGWIPADDGLYHSGIKGQRKGVRRYQLPNGTYTAAGNARYRPKKGIVSRLTGINFSEDALYLVGVGAAAVGVALAAGAITLPTASALSLSSTIAGKGAISALMANESFKNIVLPAIGTMSIANVVDKLLDDELDHSDDVSEYLEHHGIKGQQWGVRNGPPYPLNSGYGSAETISMAINKGFNKSRTRLTLDDLNEINDSRYLSYAERKTVNRVNNCSNCCAAIDLHMRGYNVKAQPREKGVKLKEITTWYKNAPNFKSVSQNDVETLLKLQGDKARSYVGIYTKNSGGIVSGHLIMHINENGKSRYYDAQSRKICNSFKDVQKLYRLDPDSYVKILRVDNLKPDFDTMKANSVYEKR